MKRLLPLLDDRWRPFVRFVASLLLLSLFLFGLISSLGCFGCLPACSQSSGSCSSSKTTVHEPSGSTQASRVTGLQATRSVWQVSRELWPHDVGLDGETCETALAHLRRDILFVAVRVPGPVAQDAPSPLMTEPPFQPIVSIRRYSDPAGLVYEAGVDERPDLLGSVKDLLPSDEGDQWLALGMASDAPDCPPGLDLEALDYSLNGSIFLDLSDRPDSGAGLTIEGYACYRGPLPSGVGQQGLEVYQGDGISCIGPQPLLLLDEPTWELRGVGEQVVTRTETIAFHHGILNRSAGTLQVDLATDSELPITWRLYGGDWGEPDLGQPLTSPLTANPGFTVFWLVSEPLDEAVADGAYMTRLTASLSSDPGDRRLTANTIWVGQLTHPPLTFRLMLPLALGE